MSDGPRAAKRGKEGAKGGKSATTPQKNEEADQIPSGIASAAEEDDLDELEPLGLQRSLSVPISGPKGGIKQANRASVALGLAADKAS